MLPSDASHSHYAAQAVRAGQCHVLPRFGGSCPSVSSSANQRKRGKMSRVSAQLEDKIKEKSAMCLNIKMCFCIKWDH